MDGGCVAVQVVNPPGACLLILAYPNKNLTRQNVGVPGKEHGVEIPVFVCT